MEVGDTVKGYLETLTSPADIVQSIDSILVGSTYRKRWNINNCYDISFIEGVGSTYGLLELSPGCVLDMPDYSLTCFQQNGQPLYPNTTSNCKPIFEKRTINHFEHLDSKWYVARTYADADMEHPSFASTKTTIYGFQGDTVINNKKWLKLFSSNNYSFQNDLKYRGLTRTENGKVFYIDTLNQLDTLYDFNLNVGDSAFFKLEGGSQQQWIKVIETDSIQLNDGAYYKRLKFNEPQGYIAFDTLNEVWIEGVGSMHGPLFPYDPRKFSEEMPDSLILTCSFSNSKYVWKHPSYSNCYIQNVLGLDETEVSDFKVYPNPFSNKVQFENPGNGEFKLTILNSLGQVVREIQIESHQKTIDLADLKAGVYIVRMHNQEQSKTMKIIKKR